MRFLFCGSRDWNDPNIIEHHLFDISHRFDPPTVTVIHGAARGLDGIAGALAKRMGFEVEREAAQWDRYGKRAAGAVRNAKMLDSGVDAIYAYKNGFDLGFNRGGTEMMVEMGLLNDIPVEVWHYVGGDARPDGFATYDIIYPPADRQRRWA